MSLELTSNFLQFGLDMAKAHGHSIYEFDHFRLDAAKLMLYRDKTEIQLPPKVIKTLAVLVENSGEILSKDDLMNRVWEDSVVEESNLSQYLYLLRKTLGDRTDGRHYIETLRRRGYRFNGDVNAVAFKPEVNGHSNGGLHAVGLATSDVAVERQGNVLRLVELAPEREPLPEPIAERGMVSPAAGSKDRRSRGVALAALFLIVLAASTALSRPTTARRTT